MTSVMYVGSPADRAETEQLLSSAGLAVVWTETAAHALTELHRRDMPVLLDLSRGAAALQAARDIRTDRPSTLMFAVVDPRRPDLTTEAVLAGERVHDRAASHDRWVINKMRALGSWYTKGLDNGSHLRTAINTVESLDALRAIIGAFFFAPVSFLPALSLS